MLGKRVCHINMTLTNGWLVMLQLLSTQKLSGDSYHMYLPLPLLSYFETFPGMFFEYLGKAVRPLQVKMTAFFTPVCFRKSSTPRANKLRLKYYNFRLDVHFLQNKSRNITQVVGFVVGPLRFKPCKPTRWKSRLSRLCYLRGTFL